MTNAEIITREQINLMLGGVIAAAGNGEKIITPMGIFDKPEDIHTFQGWKNLGYSVKKGEHAISKITIWKYKKGKAEDAEQTEDKSTSTYDMFLTAAYFFKKSQCEKIKN